MRATNRSTLALSAMLAALLLVAQSVQLAHAAEKLFDKKFPATAGGTLTLDTDNGTVVVNGADVREVTIHATLSGSQNQLEDFEITAEPDSRGVNVRGIRRGEWWLDLSWLFGGGLRVKYEIQVPREFQLELHTAGGSIESQNIKGNVRGHTSGGHLRLNSISGDIDLSTSGGSIDASLLTGSALLRTSGGRITISDATGELNVHTSGGGIRLQNIDGRVNARTSGGGIDASFRGSNHGVTLRTSGGGIRIDIPSDFKATVDAHTSGGGAYCDLPFTSRDRDEHGERNILYGDINGGGSVLEARTSGGSIRIRARG